jgi:hypothetical protein
MLMQAPAWFVWMMDCLPWIVGGYVSVWAYEWWNYPQFLGRSPGGLCIRRHPLTDVQYRALLQVSQTGTLAQVGVRACPNGLLVGEPRDGKRPHLRHSLATVFIPWSSAPPHWEIRVAWATGIRWTLLCLVGLSVLGILVATSRSAPPPTTPFHVLQWLMGWSIVPLFLFFIMREYQHASKRMRILVDAVLDKVVRLPIEHA